MRHFGWGTVTGLGMAGLLAAALPAHAQYGGSSTSGQQPAGSTSSDTGSSTSDKGTMGSSGTSRDSSMGGTASSAPSATTGTQELTGTVQKFDRDAKELTLSSSDRKLKVSDDTQVMKDGQLGSISDIQEGQQVRASFSGTGDTVQVQRIEVMSAGAKKRTGTYGTTPEAPTPSTPGPSGAAGAGGGTGGPTTGGGK